MLHFVADKVESVKEDLKDAGESAADTASTIWQKAGEDHVQMLMLFILCFVAFVGFFYEEPLKCRLVFFRLRTVQ